MDVDLGELLGRLTLADDGGRAAAVSVPAAGSGTSSGEGEQPAPVMTSELQEYLRRVTAWRASTEALMTVVGELAHQQVNFLVSGGGETQLFDIERADGMAQQQARQCKATVAALAQQTQERLLALDGDSTRTEIRIRRNLDASLNVSGFVL